MGLEYTLQSIPHNCGLIETARTNPEIGEFLELFGFADVSFEDLKFRAGDGAFAAFAAEAKAIRESNDGIADRRLNLGPRWDALLFVLSEERRSAGRASDYSWQNRAICGGDILGTSVSSTRGVPIRLLPAFETKKVAGHLSRVERNRLEDLFDHKKMSEAGVYGASGGNGGITWERLLRDVDGLCDFYVAASDNDEGVLAFCT